jgi:DNA-binding HxlR family transcriptional regulator
MMSVTTVGAGEFDEAYVNSASWDKAREYPTQGEATEERRDVLKVTVQDFEQAKDCPFRNVLDKVGDKWSFLIFAVLEDGPKRFNEIQRLIGDISNRVLTRKLRELERDGYVTRTPHADNPKQYVYTLTDVGRSILDPIKTFMDWALRTFPSVRTARTRYDRR